MDSGSIDGVNRFDSRQDRRDRRAGKVVDQLAEDGVFLRRASDRCEEPDRIAAMINLVDLHDREVVPQAIVAKMVAEWSFGEDEIGIDCPRETEVGFGGGPSRPDGD